MARALPPPEPLRAYEQPDRESRDASPAWSWISAPFAAQAIAQTASSSPAAAGRYDLTARRIRPGLSFDLMA